MLVSVCICTYKRAHLSKTLESVADLILPSNVKVEVIVVDNDLLKSAQSTVNNLQSSYPHNLIYCHEPEKNISVARNAYLAKAKGEWIASIDDDETADKYWLHNLLNAANEFNADIVFGQMMAVYPEGTPQWIIEGDFFGREMKATGTQVTSGGAGSVLIRGSALAETNYRFDLNFGLTGGEDTQLFYRLYSRGFKLIVCKEALAFELVDSNRLNRKYLLKKAYRIGQTYSRYRYIDQVSLFQKMLFIINTVLKLTFFICKTIFVFPFNKIVSFKQLIYAFDKVGKISVFCGKSRIIELYK